MVSVSIHHIFTKDTMSVLKYNNSLDLVCFAICETNSVWLVGYFIIFFYLAVHWGILYTHSSFPLLGPTSFCMKVRGQHLYLAVTVRSSSHPKTNKYWGFVGLFLALNTNYILLYSWQCVKIMLRPFCTHFTHSKFSPLRPFLHRKHCVLAYFLRILLGPK